MLAIRLGLSLACGLLMAAPLMSADPPPASQTPAAHRPPAESPLDRRVATLSKALDLNAEQQSMLRAALEQQRAEIERVWNDPSVPAAYRVGATRAITDRTADRIRAFLNDEQKKKYNPPPRQEQNAATSTDVEAWMKATRARPKSTGTTTTN